MAEARPIIKPELTPLDKAMEKFCISLALAVTLGSILVYSKLPDTIATHFNIKGEPDDYGSKAAIFIFPVIALAIYVSFTLLGRYPHKFNYPVTITEENAEHQYTLATRLLRFLKFGVLLSAGIQLFDAINRAAGRAGAGWLFIVVEILLILAPVIYFIARMLKVK